MIILRSTTAHCIRLDTAICAMYTHTGPKPTLLLALNPPPFDSGHQRALYCCITIYDGYGVGRKDSLSDSNPEATTLQSRKLTWALIREFVTYSKYRALSELNLRYNQHGRYKPVILQAFDDN